MGAGETRGSVGSVILGLGDAPCDEAVIVGRSVWPSSEERIGIELASAGRKGKASGSDCGRVESYRFSSDPGRLAVQM